MRIGGNWELKGYSRNEEYYGVGGEVIDTTCVEYMGVTGRCEKEGLCGESV